MPFIEVFAALGLRRAGSTAIDVERLLTSDAGTRAAVGEAVGGAVAAVIALADPQEIVVGGAWGRPWSTTSGRRRPACRVRFPYGPPI